MSLEIKHTEIISFFIFIFSKNQSKFFPRKDTRYFQKWRVFFLMKQIIFLKANFIFPNIWHEQAIKLLRSLVSCADWLLKCKINLYLTDVRSVTLRDNDSFYSRLVTEFLRRMNKDFGAKSGEKWQHDY